MEDESQSLVEREARQLTLLDLPPEYREALEGLKAGKVTAGEWTGERLFAAEPDKYRAIIAGLAEGLGLKSLARAFKVSVNTVRAIRDRERGPIDTDKRAISLRLREFARMASDRLIDEIDSIDIDKLPIAAAIAIDKMQLLDGEATQISGTSADRIKVDVFNEFVASLPGIGLEPGEKEATREAPAALPAAGDGLVLEAEIVTGTEGQSVVFEAATLNS